MPSRTRIQSQSRATYKSPSRKPSPKHSPPPKATSSSAPKTRVDAFRTGTKPMTPTESPPTLPMTKGMDVHPDDLLLTRESPPPSSPPTQAITTPKKARKPFRIGGKGKATDQEATQSTFRVRKMQSPTVEPPSSPSLPKTVRPTAPIKDVIEETPEEKAERKRAELKRKNEEAAKKLAQAKKKKRF